MDTEKMIREAMRARENAYAPYSGFRVGACLETESGKLYCGCNMENASYPAGICAERAAVANAVSHGERVFSGIAIVGGGKDGTVICPPCGICRQTLSEFCGGDFPIILSDGSRLEKYNLSELLPCNFGADNMSGGEK
jgi:cytidine deaminase